jgi:hypothetical protein
VFVTVVIGNGGYDARVGCQGHRCEGPTLAFEPPDKLGNEMLGIACTSSVAERENLVAGGQRPADCGGRGGDALHTILRESLVSGGRLTKNRSSGVNRIGGHDVSPKKN